MSAPTTWVRRRYMTPDAVLFAWHAGLALVLAWWSFILAWPRSTFAVSRSYDRFAAISADEQFWSAGFAFAALAGAVGCWAAWPQRARQPGRRLPALRMTSAALMAVVHGIVAVFMFGGSDVGTGPGVYVLIMIGAYLLMRAEYERS